MTMTIDLWIPCYLNQFYPETGMNVVKILRKLGCEVRYNPRQGCCGLPAFSAGFEREALAVAKSFVRDFSDSENYLLVPSTACLSMVRNHLREILDQTWQKQCYQLEKRTFELTEFIVDVLGVQKIEGAQLEARATFMDACLGLRECGIAVSPRILLQNVSGLELLEMHNKEMCCGFGGNFSTRFSAISAALAEQKTDDATATQAEYIISTDSACLMHLESYIKKNRRKIKTLHIADVLASGW